MSVLYKKSLNKAYKKRFKILNKTFFNDPKQGILLFSEYLNYLRDNIIISAQNNLENVELNTKIATLNSATAELASWLKSEDDLKKEFYWNNFCELLKLNMKEWLVLNDSV